MHDWIDEKIVQVFDCYMDELSNEKRIEIESKCLTIEQKLNFLKEENKKFEESFK
jgi:hypothetical protein